MPKYPGRIVSATPPSVSLSGASGIWTLEEVAQYEQAGTWPVGVSPSDPNFKQTVLLLHGDGTNGAQNNTFLDSSSNNFTITRNPATGPNAPTQGTFSPFSAEPGKWGNYFSGTSDYLNLASMPAIGTGDFTITCWVWPQLYARGAFHVGGLTGAVNGIAIHAYNSGSGGWNLYAKNTQTVSNSGIPPLNTWYHLAVVRSGTTTTLYVNGTSLITVTSDTTNYSQTALAIGGFFGTSNLWQGYISDFRIVIGTALHTGNFTPPTAPSTAVSGTSVLTCQDNRFVDKASPPNAITVNGSPRVTPFSPFAPTAAYSPSVNGGGGYFDGTGDFLSIADNAAFELSNSNFAIEAWVYPLALPASGSIANIASQYITTGSRSFLFALYNNSGTMQLLFQPVSGSTDTAISQNFAFKVGEWAHVAAIRSGNNITLYGNGVSLGTTAYSSTINNATGPYLVGCRYNASSAAELLFTGYIAGHRLIVGSDTAPSGIPTTPPTDVTNTKLLLNFTNAGIIDNTGKNNLETVGNAQIDTATKKYGTGSMEFDENGDYLTLPSTIDVAFGTGNFTIEMWARFAVSTVGNGQGLFQLSNGYLNSQVRGPAAGCDNATGRWAIYSGTTQTTHGSLVPSTNTWYHVAYVRNSGTTKLYIDGTEIISVADTTNYTDTNFTIGGWYSSGFLLNGFIDDLRITKGVARYPTEPFPTAPFPDL